MDKHKTQDVGQVTPQPFPFPQSQTADAQPEPQPSQTAPVAEYVSPAPKRTVITCSVCGAPNVLVS